MAVLDKRIAVRLRNGEPVCGVSIGMLHPALIQMCGLADFDFLVIDNEHGPSSIETTAAAIQAAYGAGIVPIVRTFESDIARLLDAGAGGIQVPLVETAEQAARIVAACRYPPNGSRSVAFSTPAAGYGFYGGPAHIALSDEAVIVVLMIETARAVANMDEILAVPGIDAICLGPTDMSYSLGVPGNGRHPKVKDAIAGCVAKCIAANVAVGTNAFTMDDLRESSAMGMRYHTTMLTFMIGNALRATRADMKGIVVAQD